MSIIYNLHLTYRLRKVIYLIILVSFTQIVFTQSWKSYPYTREGSLIEFPRDEGYHPSESVEWWYANGHFTGNISGHRYSFMVSYFYRPAYIFDGFRIFQITDETDGKTYSETLPCNYPVLAIDSLHLVASFISGNISEEWINQVDSDRNMLPFQYQLNAEMSNASLSIQCSANKPPLILNDNGLLDLGATNYSYYYSITDLDLTGNIEFDGIKEKISGLAWFDRQYGNFNPYQNESYEWFNVKLTDGVDLNIWNIFSEENKIPGTKKYRICSAYLNDTTFLTTEQFDIKRIAYTYTPDNARCYSSAWNITSELLDLNLNCEAVLKNSEINIQEIGMRFYEGSILITGTHKGNAVTGMGFAELVHSYEKPALLIHQPNENEIWNNSSPITWAVSNADDGNPLKFDFTISTASAPNFKKEFFGLTDTFLYWNPGSFIKDSIITAKITGYSTDNTLSGSGQRVFKVQPLQTEFSICPGESFNLDLNLNPADYFYSWLYNGENADYASQPAIQINPVSPESEGIYACIVTNDYFIDTTNNFNLQISPCTWQKNIQSTSLKIYPNPCDNFLMINLPIRVADCLISIKNVNGTEVYRSVIQASTDEIETSNLNPGLYMLEIINPSARNIQIYKFVKN